MLSRKKNVRVYDLVMKKFIKKLEAGVREISSISIHPGGMFPILSLVYCSISIIFNENYIIVFMQVIMLLWEVKMESYVGLTWIFLQNLTKFSCMFFINTYHD